MILKIIICTSIIFNFSTSEDYYTFSLLVRHFVDEKASFARGRVLGHTGLPLYESSFESQAVMPCHLPLSYLLVFYTFVPPKAQKFY